MMAASRLKDMRNTQTLWNQGSMALHEPRFMETVVIGKGGPLANLGLITMLLSGSSPGPCLVAEALFLKPSKKQYHLVETFHYYRTSLFWYQTVSRSMATYYRAKIVTSSFPCNWVEN